MAVTAAGRFSEHWGQQVSKTFDLTTEHGLNTKSVRTASI